jgi:predicted peptidase
MSQQISTFMFDTMALRYLTHVPPGYGKEKGKRWPLILFLHATPERGTDLELIKTYGIPKIVEENKEFPFVTVSPQCPPGTWWSFELDALNGLLNEFIATHPAVDTSRIYVTGTDMGGYGAWNLAIAHPERFAAIAPISGGGDPDAVCAIRDVPVWAFHGQLDSVVLLRESRKMVDALRECGGKVRFTIYPNGGHEIYERAYADPRLYEWLLGHTR